MTRANGNFLVRAASVFLIFIIINRFIQLNKLDSATKRSFESQSESQFQCDNQNLNQRIPLKNKIPLIIHQAFPHLDIPEPLARLRSTWMDHHFEWKFMLWKEKDLDDLIRFEFPWAFEMYSSSITFEQKVDIAKYFILLTYGGVFADISLMSIRNGIRLHKMGGLLLPLVNITHSTKSYQVSNAWMASEPGHPFLLFMGQVLVAEFNEDIPDFGGSASLYNSIRDFEVQRLPTDPPTHFLEPGYVVIPDSKDPLYPRECRDNSRKFDVDACAEKLVSVDSFAVSYRTTFDLKM